MPQPTDWHHVWEITRSVLEALYFLAGIGIFVAACYAAKQVRLASDQIKTAKEIANANSRRESVKLAAEQCRYYAEQVVPAMDLAVKKYRDQKCTFLAEEGKGTVPGFVIKNGKLFQVYYDIEKITPEEWDKVKTEVVTCLNKLESFAIPFAAGVADDDTGFTETAQSFLSGLRPFLPVIYYLQSMQGGTYSSTLMLFNIWYDRVLAETNELLDRMRKKGRPTEDSDAWKSRWGELVEVAAGWRPTGDLNPKPRGS